MVNKHRLGAEAGTRTAGRVARPGRGDKNPGRGRNGLPDDIAGRIVTEFIAEAPRPQNRVEAEEARIAADRKAREAAARPYTDPNLRLDDMILGDEEEWQEQALCSQTDPEAFFPEKGQSTREAKKICERCPVRADCLMYALGHDERFGIWGGLSERERRKLKRRGLDAENAAITHGVVFDDDEDDDEDEAVAEAV